MELIIITVKIASQLELSQQFCPRLLVWNKQIIFDFNSSVILPNFLFFLCFLLPGS